MDIVINYQKKDTNCYSPEDWFGNEQLRLSALLKNRIYIGKDSCLYVESRDRNKRKDFYRRVDSLSKAIRQQNHILNRIQFEAPEKQNESEYNFFREMDATINQTINALMAWQDLSDTEREAVKLPLKESLAFLKNCRLFLKKELAEQLSHLAKIEDSLGRKNPGAKKASAVSAKIKSRKRQEQIERSIRRARDRQFALKTEERYEQEYLRKATLALGLLGSSNQTSKKKDIGKIRYFLQSIWLNPYREQAKQLELIIQNIKD